MNCSICFAQSIYMYMHGIIDTCIISILILCERNCYFLFAFNVITDLLLYLEFIQYDNVYDAMFFA